MSFEKMYYEQGSIWEKLASSEENIKRIVQLAELIPADAASILDVGCGNGMFLNELRSRKIYRRLCGFDRSREALKYVKTEKYAGDIDRLPFKKREFDLVMCSEVIEHLPLAIYSKALQEVSRVARKYIIITVPNNENLKVSQVVCPSCQTRFNRNYHMRSFNEKKMQLLLNEQRFDCIDIRSLEGLDSPVGVNLVLKLWPGGSRFGGVNICPLCGYISESVSKRREEMKTGIMDSIKIIWPKRKSYRWLCGIYQRR